MALKTQHIKVHGMQERARKRKYKALHEPIREEEQRLKPNDLILNKRGGKRNHNKHKECTFNSE